MKNNFYEVSISRRDKIYPVSIVNMVDECLGEVINKNPVQVERMANPEPIFYEIRDAFWREVEIAEDSGRKVNLDAVCNGIMPLPMFNSSLKSNRYLAAWLVMPVVKYEKRIKSMLDSATKRYEEILTMPLKVKKFKKIKKEQGEDETLEYEEYDMSRVNTWLKLMSQLENRVHGSAVQKQLVMNTTEPDVKPGETAELDMDELNKKLKELEGKMHDSIIDTEV